MKSRKWTNKEEQFVRDNYHLKSCEEVMKELNRTKYSIFWKASLLKLKNINA